MSRECLEKSSFGIDRIKAVQQQYWAAYAAAEDFEFNPRYRQSIGRRSTRHHVLSSPEPVCTRSYSRDRPSAKTVRVAANSSQPLDAARQKSKLCARPDTDWPPAGEWQDRSSGLLSISADR